MGQKKKKKSGGGGRRSKGRTPSKDQNFLGGDNSELVAEELTALRAIFQEDCKVAPELPAQISIKLRPYSKDTGYENLDVSALLTVRCLPGYPYKCPKLQITPEKGLSKADADNLLSLLHEQANSNAREGRVMIYSLVEAAQEFLSEVVPLGQLQVSVPGQATDLSGQLSQKDVTLPFNKTCFSRGPFVYGFIDLFTGSGESWQWGLGMEERAELNSSAHSDALNVSKHHSEIQKKKIDQNVNVAVIQDTKQSPLLYPAVKLDTLEEESDDASKDTNLNRSSSEESSGEGTVDKEFFLVEHLSETDDGDVDSEPSQSVSSDSVIHNHLSQTLERDLILAHLLRLACAPKGQLADALPEITSELHSLGVCNSQMLV